MAIEEDKIKCMKQHFIEACPIVLYLNVETSGYGNFCLLICEHVCGDCLAHDWA